MNPETQNRSAEELLKSVSLFEKCSDEEIRKLVLGMRPQLFDKGETILFQGIISNQLFLVSAGSVSVFSRKEKITRFIASLERGAYFGEISLVKNCAATATVKANVRETEVYTLDYDVIKEVLQSNPDVKADLESKIIERNRYRLEAFQKQGELVSPLAAPAPI